MLPLPFSPRIALALALALAAAGTGAEAAGLGSGSSAQVLGQPLDFMVPLRVDAGETLAPECVGAEVVVGERPLPAPLVRTALEMTGPESARIRVVAAPPLDEPVVTVTVYAGCASRVARRYVLFVEPSVQPVTAPAYVAAPPVVSQALATVLPTSAAPEASAAASASVSIAHAAPSAGGAGVVRKRVRTANGDAAPSAPRETARPMRRPNTRRAAPPARTAARTSVVHPVAERRAVRRTAPAAAARAAPMPRLQLEAAEPTPSAEARAVAEALEAVAEAASAARSAAIAASVASERIATLERTVEQLRTEASGQRDLAAQLRQRLAQSERSSRWLPPLLALVLLLAGLTLWLAWRLSAKQKHRETAWRRTLAPARGAVAAASVAGKPPAAPIPLMTSEFSAREDDAPAPPPPPAWPPPVREAPPSELPPLPRSEVERPETVLERTHVLAPQPVAEPGASRDVSIEELIDLEQQAEFFVVLGQDEAAIDLLVEYLRHTGGGSPLPYLKLLEIYGRRGDREAYERTRQRFNRRFNAYAPEWGADLAQGRSLDEYPEVLPRLAQAWPRPIDAMAELEALLFRKSRGELFDLPAYREVLFLYSLARDLLDRESLASGSVDLLLPLADHAEPQARPPHPYLGLESDAMPLSAGEERATVPVDLDLSQDERPSSIFGPLDEPAPRR